ncbi:unnamed protein product [Urochloa humidicola]
MIDRSIQPSIDLSPAHTLSRQRPPWRNYSTPPRCGSRRPRPATRVLLLQKQAGGLAVVRDALHHDTELLQGVGGGGHEKEEAAAAVVARTGWRRARAATGRKGTRGAATTAAKKKAARRGALESGLARG